MPPTANDYIPQHVSEAAWAATRDVVLSLVDRLSSSSASRMKYQSHLAAFAAWAWKQGIPLDLGSVLELDLIERYIAVGMPETAPSTRAARRAILRRIARRASPTLSEVPAPESIAYRRVRAPYTAAEVDGFWRLTRAQPTEGRQRALTAVLALALGCGLDCRDMAWVRGVDIHDDPTGAVHVTVCGGSRPRTVTTLSHYGPQLLKLAAVRDDELLIGGRTLGRHNVTSPVLTRLIGDTKLPRLVVARLRSTWLLEHVRLGTPLPVLMPAAGLRTVRPLEDLLEYLPSPPVECASAWLQGHGPNAATA